LHIRILAWCFARRDVSRLAQVKAALAEGSAPPSGQPVVTDDIEGRHVLSVHAPVKPLGWLVFVELPIDEAYAPLYSSVQRPRRCSSRRSHWRHSLASISRVE
jgi:hypothetical protein